MGVDWRKSPCRLDRYRALTLGEVKRRIIHLEKRVADLKLQLLRGRPVDLRVRETTQMGIQLGKLALGQLRQVAKEKQDFLRTGQRAANQSVTQRPGEQF